LIKLFNINDHIIDTSKLTGLHDSIVGEFEQEIANFVGAKYACGVSSATNAIFLTLLNKEVDVEVPSIIPPVVCNAILTSGNTVSFRDDIDWVGDSYILHDFGDYKIVDSAQKIEHNQYKQECNPQDLMLFSFYPTKPIGSFDGGLIVSDDKEKIEWLKILTKNGMEFCHQSWKRRAIVPGFKMYLNAIQAYIASENYKKLSEKYQALSWVRHKYNQAFDLNNSSNHLYRVNIEDRAGFLEKAKKEKIEIGIHYSAVHLNNVYCRENLILPKSEIESLTTISLPFNECLVDKQIEKVINLVNEHGHFKNI
tara:strand:- start:922 stop:1851 length:930 start_codon:yes stop_codon:yes gene_type:complete